MSEGQLGGDEVGGWRRSQVDEAFYLGRALGKSASRDYYRLTNPLPYSWPFNEVNTGHGVIDRRFFWHSHFGHIHTLNLSYRDWKFFEI